MLLDLSINISGYTSMRRIKGSRQCALIANTKRKKLIGRIISNLTKSTKKIKNPHNKRETLHLQEESLIKSSNYKKKY